MEINDLFDYGYYIYQSPDYFKFSIDSVLLAEFVVVRKNKHSLMDFCSGNAPIPMILNKKFGAKLNITGIELQQEIFELGQKSIEYNKIDNIRFINDDILTNDLYKKEKFDIITCNPPYFKVSDSKVINDNDIKAIQRHEIKLNLDGLVKTSTRFIENMGYFYMVHRPDRISDIIYCLRKYNYGIKRIQFVYDNPNKEAVLVLIESQFNGKDFIKVNKPLVINNLNSYKNIFEEE